MFKRVLAIAVIGAAALTSVGARASDWGAGYRYAPPPVVRYVPPVRYVAPRYYPAYRWAPLPAYRWAPSYAYRYGYYPNYHYWNGHGPIRWSDRDDHRDDHHDDHDDHDDDNHDWRGR